MDLAQQNILLAPPSGRLLVVKLLGDATVELVQVHRFDSRFDLVVPGLHVLDYLHAGRLLGLVGGEHSVTEPFEDRLRNDQFMQNAGELASEDFLARIRLRAFSSVAGAVVIHVLSLLQLADKQAAAVATVDQPGIGEIVLHFASLVLSASIEHLLDALPTFAGDDWLVGARVRCAVPIEIASVQALSENLVNDTAVELPATQFDALSVAFTDECPQ